MRQRCQHYLSAALLVAQGSYLLTLTRGYAELINRGLGNRLLPMPLALPAVTLNLYWSRQADDEAGSPGCAANWRSWRRACAERGRCD